MNEELPTTTIACRISAPWTSIANRTTRLQSCLGNFQSDSPNGVSFVDDVSSSVRGEKKETARHVRLKTRLM